MKIKFKQDRFLTWQYRDDGLLKTAARVNYTVGDEIEVVSIQPHGSHLSVLHRHGDQWSDALPNCAFDRDDILTTVAVPRQITIEMCAGLLCNCFDVQSPGWGHISGYKFAEGISRKDFNKGGKYANVACDFDGFIQYNIAFVPGCALKIAVDDGDEMKTELLTLEKAKRGCEVFAKVFPKHFQDWLDGNDDAITGDLWVQSCLFADYIEEHGHEMYS